MSFRSGYKAAYPSLVATVYDIVVHGPGGLRRRADGDILLGGELE
jgi:hypothetical protein